MPGRSRSARHSYSERDTRGYKSYPSPKQPPSCGFLVATNHNPDLSIEGHRIRLLQWLNKWGGRRAHDAFDELSEGLRVWYGKFGPLLFESGKTIVELSQKEEEIVGEAYRGLFAGIQGFGPTLAAKTLFAIRPHALPPWDEAIRVRLGLRESKHGYLDYLVASF